MKKWMDIPPVACERYMLWIDYLGVRRIAPYANIVGSPVLSSAVWVIGGWFRSTQEARAYLAGVKMDANV